MRWPTTFEVVASLLAVGLLLILAWNFDPFGRLKAAQTATAVASADAVNRGIEVDSERQTARNVAAANTLTSSAKQVATEAIARSHNPDLPHDKLDQARLARIRADDHRLCDIRPSLGGCPKD